MEKEVEEMVVEQGRTGHRRGKTISTRVSIWYKPESQSIALCFKDFGLITTVSDKLGRKRCHRHLYNHLRNILDRQGVWPQDR
jgi:hypothetical protein